MAAAYPSPPAPGALLEALLHRAPLDVLLFDAELVCRYAAPAGETLLGRARHALVGAPADAIFGPEGGDLVAALRVAADAAAPSQFPVYRYETGETTRTYHCWSVAVEPVLLHDYRGREEFRGVLVTLADIADLADERDRLREAEARLTGENAELRLQLAAARRRAEAARAGVRDRLAPVAGYLQVLARRPEVLAGEDPGALAARLLPSVDAAVAAADAGAG